MSMAASAREAAAIVPGVGRTMFAITERTARTSRHTSFYLSAGAEDATPIIFLHGWPELSSSWRHQLPVFAALGFRAIAPDMRGYGRSSVYSRHEDYALEHTVQDMVELLDSLGHKKAIWVGHDWGSPVTWSLAGHHPDKCIGIVNLCVPYIPNGFATENLVPLVDRKIYPESEFPAGQWEYWYFYRENFDKARQELEANIKFTIKALFRGGNPGRRDIPGVTAYVRKNRGWFGGSALADDLPIDNRVVTDADFHAYVASLERNGFFGPDSWYMNDKPNIAFAGKVKNDGVIEKPVLFLHGAYDYVCYTLTTRLPEPMRQSCPRLTEAVVASGHWMAQEKPVAVNASIAKWLAQFPESWPQ